MLFEFRGFGGDGGEGKEKKNSQTEEPNTPSPNRSILKSLHNSARTESGTAAAPMLRTKALPGRTSTSTSAACGLVRCADMATIDTKTGHAFFSMSMVKLARALQPALQTTSAGLPSLHTAERRPRRKIWKNLTFQLKCSFVGNANWHRTRALCTCRCACAARAPADAARARRAAAAWYRPEPVDHTKWNLALSNTILW